MGHENALEALNMTQEMRKVEWYGTYIGVVRNSFDPDELGRVKVEVLPIFKDIKEIDLPWALPKWGLNNVKIPAEGETVWVFFQGGEILKPVYESGALPVKKIGTDDTTPPQEAKDEGDPHEWEQHELGDPVRHQKVVDAIKKGEDDNKIREGNPWKEPDIMSAPEYPYNSTEISPGGIVRETDDTPDNRRVHIYFPMNDENIKDDEPELGKGNFDTMDKDLNRHIRVVKDFFRYVGQRSIEFALNKMVKYCVGPILIESQGSRIDIVAPEEIRVESKSHVLIKAPKVDINP